MTSYNKLPTNRLDVWATQRLNGSRLDIIYGWKDIGSPHSHLVFSDGALSFSRPMLSLMSGLIPKIIAGSLFLI